MRGHVFHRLGRIPLVMVVCGLSLPVASQNEAPGDQLFSFGIDQTIRSTDNIRLDPVSLGTTTSSDTALSFGFLNETGLARLEFDLGGVIRLVDDPLLGFDSGLRDPTARLSYTRENANSRFALLLDYARPDLAFLDPLEREDLDDQDLFRGTGQREDYLGQLRLETGLAGPLGLSFGLETRQRSYTSTTDPTLFDNRTDTADLGLRFTLSPVTSATLDASRSFYSAEDARRTDRRTGRIVAGLDHQLSPIDRIRADLGYSEVRERFDALPGLESLTTGLIGGLSLERALPDGTLNADLTSTLSQDGRQTTLEAGRFLALPLGSFSFSLGATTGENFDVEPIGRLSYTADRASSRLSAGLSRQVSISDTLSQAEITTRADLDYRYDINALSVLSFTAYYADIELTGQSAGVAPRRSRTSLTATYSRNVTEDWELRAGYEYRNFDDTLGRAGQSDAVFFSLSRRFDTFR